MAYFNTKQTITVQPPVPTEPSYEPPVVPTPSTPTPGSTPTEPGVVDSYDTTLTLYKVSDDKRKVSKDLGTAIATYNITIKGDVNLMQPEILINDSIPDANYAYIAALDRYYYLSLPVLMSGHLYKLPMTIDSLMSNASGIRSCSGVIARQEYLYNLYLPDSEFKVLANNNKKTLKFNRTPFTKNLNYIMTVSGGN